MKQELLVRAAALEPATFNEDTRTVEVVFSTGADVRRYDMEGAFIERLEMTPAAVDLSAIRGAPVLNNHDRFGGVEAILGIVEEASVDGQRGVAKIRFGQRPEIQGIVADVQGGIIRSVSAGYTVQEWRVTKENGQRVKTAVRWTPKEISFTPLAADPQATVRSIEGSAMTDHDQLRTIAEAVGVRSDFVDGLVQRNVNLETGRAEIIREAARNTPTIDARQPAAVTREQGPDDHIRAAGEALYHRINPAHQLSDLARPYAGRRLADIYREELRRRGHGALGSDAEIVTRAMHSISDFSSGIFAELFNKSMVTLRTAPPAVAQVFKRATVDDFREKHLFEISDGPALAKVGETGEVTSGTIIDRKLSSYRIDSYARMFSLSFAAQVNDDMGALSDLSAKMTRGARNWFSGFLVDVILSNPNLADGKAVFHADHGNLAEGPLDLAGEPDVGLTAARLAMRLQADASGNPLNLSPKYILIPAALEAIVERLMALLYPNVPEIAIVSARGLTPLVEARLDLASQAVGWYLFCDPSEAPVFEYSELSGYEGPRVDVDSDFDVLGTKIRVVWHVGAGAIDYRGAFKSPNS